MTVNLYEPQGFNREKDWCSRPNSGAKTLQVQENVLRVLNAEKDFDHTQFWQYCEAMEAIHENKFLEGTNVVPEVHTLVDSYFGALGVAEEVNYITVQGGNKYV